MPVSQPSESASGSRSLSPTRVSLPDGCWAPPRWVDSGQRCSPSGFAARTVTSITTVPAETTFLCPVVFLHGVLGVSTLSLAVLAASGVDTRSVVLLGVSTRRPSALAAHATGLTPSLTFSRSPGVDKRSEEYSAGPRCDRFTRVRSRGTIEASAGEPTHPKEDSP